MYEQLRKRFHLNEDLLNKLVKNEDFEELFRDYETIHKQSQNIKKGTEQYELYQGLLSELEEEFVDLFISISKKN